LSSEKELKSELAILHNKCFLTPYEISLHSDFNHSKMNKKAMKIIGVNTCKWISTAFWIKKKVDIE